MGRVSQLMKPSQVWRQYRPHGDSAQLEQSDDYSLAFNEESKEQLVPFI